MHQTVHRRQWHRRTAPQRNRSRIDRAHLVRPPVVGTDRAASARTAREPAPVTAELLNGCDGGIEPVDRAEMKRAAVKPP